MEEAQGTTGPKLWVWVIIGLILVSIIVEITCEIIQNRVFAYYRESPWFLVIPGTAGLIGGLAILLYARLSARTKRQLTICGWGLVNIAGVIFVGMSLRLTYLFFYDSAATAEGNFSVYKNIGNTRYLFLATTLMMLVVLVFSLWRFVRTILAHRICKDES